MTSKSSKTALFERFSLVRVALLPTSSDITVMLTKNVLEAKRLKRAGYVTDFPKLDGWNQDYPLYPYQEVGALWAYLVEKGINADQVGLGKMIQTFALVSLTRQLGQPYRTLVVCESNVHKQWVDECNKFTDLDVVKADGSPEDRRNAYNDKWDICVSTYPLLRRDHAELCSIKPDMVVFDESGYFRHHNIQTHGFAKELTEEVGRVVLLDGTPIQNSLLDIHGQFEVFHNNVLGSAVGFGKNYINWEEVTAGSRKELRVKSYKNIGDFRKRIDPYMLRRTPKQVGVQLPEIITEDVWLDLPQEQRKVYKEVRDELLGSYSNSRSDFRGGFFRLQFAVDTTSVLGCSPGCSVKTDWIINKIKGDLKEEKIIIFAVYKEVLRYVRDRLKHEGISTVMYTGDDVDGREADLEAFTNGSAQVLLGTTAIMRGKNLQMSGYLIAMDELANPQQMIQLAGRIRRIGSTYSNVFVIFLRTNDTFEEQRWKKNKTRAMVPDFLFDEKSGIYDQLSDRELLDLIKG